jgi:hypothetical protein
MIANFVIATVLLAGSALSPVIDAFSSASAGRGGQSRPLRVFVHTDDNGVAEELAARRASVKDLSEALASRKKLFIVVEDEEKSEIQIDVLGRGLTVPKVVLGLGPRPGESAIGTSTTKNAELRIRVTVTSGDLAAELKNKNKANDNPRGWKSAADDLADQLDKWVLEHRAAIGKGGLTR